MIKTAIPERTAASALEAATLPEAFQLTAEANAGRPALRAHGGAHAIDWSCFADRVEGIAAGLAALGIARGDRVALMLGNRTELHLIDTAAVHLGAVPVSIPAMADPDVAAALLTSCSAAMLITERQFAQPAIAAAKLARVADVVVVDGYRDGPRITLADLELLGERNPFDFEGAWRDVRPGDPLTVVYEGGARGTPITHADVLQAVRAHVAAFGAPKQGTVVTCGESANLIGRTCGMYIPTACGYGVITCLEARNAIAVATAVRPTWFVAPGRVWADMRTAIELIVADRPEAYDTERVRADLRRLIGLDRASSATIAGPSRADLVLFFRALGIPLDEMKEAPE